MTSIAKLKDRARKHEQKEDWKAAIEVYQKVLEAEQGGDELELELGLFNRIGDLYLRIDQTDQAVSYYEQAADKYAEAGFFNNAIALCNKALRHRPGRSQIYLKLSRLCADQGFVIDARRWILEYAEREVKAGRVDAALDGLSDFVENSTDPEVREFLAEQLSTHAREHEAAVHYAKAYGERLAAGEREAADRAAKRARSIDPSVDLEAAASAAGPLEVWSAEEAGVGEEESSGIEMAGGLEDELDPGAAGPDAEADEAEDPAALPGLETRTTETLEDDVEVEGLEGLESSGGEPVVEQEEEEEGEDDRGASVSAVEDEIAGLEVSYTEAGAAVDPEEVEEEAATLGGLETFGEVENGQADEDAGVGPGAEDDEGEPLPGMDEEAEPLPLLATESYDEEPAAAEASADLLEPTAVEEETREELEAQEEAESREELEAPEEDESREELEAPEEAETWEEPVAAEETELGLVEPVGHELAVEDTRHDLLEPAHVEEEEERQAPVPPLGFEEHPPREESAPREERAADDEEGEEEGEEEPTEGMDLGSLDLDFGALGDPEPSLGGAHAEVPMEVDAAAILDRAKELVNRGIWQEALQELGLLEAAEPGPAVLRPALAVVKEITRRQPDDMAALQRRVEYAARVDDEPELIAAYLRMGEALDRTGAAYKARAMYERVLELDPHNAAARAALDFPAGGGAGEEDMDVLLGLVDGAEVGPLEPVPDEGADPELVAMLSQFKARVTESAGGEDAGAHYDLGLAFKEMGLVDEAIAEFQTALTGGEDRLKVYEELGQCFILKTQYNIALQIFDRALRIAPEDPVELLGVYYHLGQCHEALGQREQAREAYARVLAIDPSFQDVPDRMARL